MKRIVTVEEMYQLDKAMEQEIGVDNFTLMEHAAVNLTHEVKKSIHKNELITIVIGPGNNGGDAFVIARLLKNEGYKVEVVLIPNEESLSGAAKKAFEIYRNCGYDYKKYESKNQFLKILAPCSVVIDAIFGIGLNREISGVYKEIIDTINSMEKMVISIDIPSGVNGDGALYIDGPIKAVKTITVQCYKKAAFLPNTEPYFGNCVVTSIGVPPKIELKYCDNRFLVQFDDIKASFRRRDEYGYKGTFGKGLIIGGSEQMIGAPMLSTKAAIRSGLGLTTVAVPKQIHAIAAAHSLEAMYISFPSMDGQFTGELPEEFTAYDGIAVGPGMGRKSGSKLVVKKLLLVNIPLVIDADALYHLKDLLQILKQRQALTVITPHEGEFARLLNVPLEEVSKNRFKLSADFAKNYNTSVILKGPSTIITIPNGTQYVCTSGNVGLAKGGSGDVLTGMVLACILQNEEIETALCQAVYCHGYASQSLYNKGYSTKTMMATDIINEIPHVFFEMEHDCQV